MFSRNSYCCLKNKLFKKLNLKKPVIKASWPVKIALGAGNSPTELNSPAIVPVHWLKCHKTTVQSALPEAT